MLTREDVAMVVARFEADRERYVRVTGEVHKRIYDVLQGRALKNVVTSRAKSIESLRRSLLRDRHDRVVGGPDDMLRPLTDLAGVRVLLYRAVDVETAVHAVRSRFPILREKDKRSPDGYSAYHLVIHEWCGEDDEFCDVRHLRCEIQICTIVDHLWNELEHDIKYKQPDGRPDDGQIELLRSLRHELALCGGTVERLMERTSRRAEQNQQELADFHDLRRYLEGRFECAVTGPFDELWELLSGQMRLVDRRAMDALFELGPARGEAERIRDRFDVDHAHREVGFITVMLLPAFSSEDLREIIAARPAAPPLWRFIHRVLAGQGQGTT